MRLRTSLICVGAVMAGCQSPEPEQDAPLALGQALGTPHGLEQTPQPDDPRRLWRCDLSPFVSAGLPGATWELAGVLEELLRARAKAFDEREPEVDASGHVLRVRAEPGSLAAAQDLIAQLRAETTQPILFDVHLVEVPSERLAFLDADPAADKADAFLAQLARDLGEGRATTLTRRRLRLTPGQRASVRETRSRRPVVRVRVEDGLPTSEQETVEDGLALHATCWLGSGGQALAHVEVALQQEARETPRTLAVGYHRPPDGSKGPQDELVEAAIDLPSVRLTGLRGQLRLAQDTWAVAAAGPAVTAGRRVVALVRARWAQRPASASETQSRGPVLESLRVALPQRTAEVEEERGTKSSPFFGSTLFGGRVDRVLDGLKAEYARQSSVSVRNDIGFGRQIPEFSRSLQAADASPDDGWVPLLPEPLAAQLREFQAIRWSEGNALVFRWDQLHVLHERSTARRLRELIQGIEAWRNQPLRVRAEWVEVEHAELDGLSTPEGLRAALPRLRTRGVLAAYHLTTRSGAWTELSLAQTEAVLWGYFGPDRASPETRVVSRGSRLGVRPRRYGDGRLELAVRFGHQQTRGGTLDPVRRAGGWVHQPRFHESTLEENLTLRDGEPQLLLAEPTAGGRLRALVVTCWE